MAISVWKKLPGVDLSLWALLLLVVGTVAVVGAVAAATVPLGKLVGEEPNKVVGAFHGTAATVFLLSATVTTYLGWRLISAKLAAYEGLKVPSVLNVALALFTIGRTMVANPRSGPRSLWPSS